MYNGGEAADQMVSYAFKGGEVVLRLSGAAAKNLAVYLTALLKQGGPSKGKTTLKRMIADGKELTVQRIDADQIPYFNAMAKKYGVVFVAVRDKQNPDGKCDIMFRLEDSARVNRIFDRLAISEHPDVAHIKSEIIRSKEEKKSAASLVKGKRIKIDRLYKMDLPLKQKIKYTPFALLGANIHSLIISLIHKKLD